MNRIVTEKCKTLRALARQALSGNFVKAIMLVLLCEIIVMIPSILFSMLPAFWHTRGAQLAFNVISVLLAAPITLSMTSFFIRLFRQREISGAGDIRFGFMNFGKALALNLRILFFTWLWSLLFVIPGIIAALRYSQAFYLMADAPGKSAKQCMRESSFIMRNNKLKYFALQLSFIGWSLLASLPAGIIQIRMIKASLPIIQHAIELGRVELATAYILKTVPAVSLLSLLAVPVVAYMETANAAFFDILVGKLVVKSVDNIIEAEPVNVESPIEISAANKANAAAETSGAVGTIEAAGSAPEAIGAAAAVMVTAAESSESAPEAGAENSADEASSTAGAGWAEAGSAAGEAGESSAETGSAASEAGESSAEASATAGEAGESSAEAGATASEAGESSAETGEAASEADEETGENDENK